MKNLILASLFLIVILSPLPIFADQPPQSWIPPTNAYARVATDSGNLNATNYTSVLSIKGGHGVTVTTVNSSVLISSGSITPVGDRFGWFASDTSGSGGVKDQHFYNFSTGYGITATLGADDFILSAINFVNATSKICAPSYAITAYDNNTGLFTCSHFAFNDTNTAQGLNLGTHGIGIYTTNANATQLQFLKLLSGNSGCVISSNATNAILTCNITDTNTAQARNIGSGSGHLAAGNDNATQIKIRTLTGVNGISVTNDTLDTYVTGTAYQNNTGSNLGTSGTGVFTSMSGSVLQFLKVISANNNCAFSSNATNVILTCTSSGGTITGSQNVGHGTGSSGVLATATATTIKGKNLTAGSGVTIINNVTDITISATGSGNVTGLGIVNRVPYFSTTSDIRSTKLNYNVTGFEPSTNGGLSLGSASKNFYKGFFTGNVTISNSSSLNTNAISTSSANTITLGSALKFIYPALNNTLIIGNSGTNQWLKELDSILLVSDEMDTNKIGPLTGSEIIIRSQVLKLTPQTDGNTDFGTNTKRLNNIYGTNIFQGASNSKVIDTINSQNGPTVNIVGETGNITITNSSAQVKIGAGSNIVITGGAAQRVTKVLTLDKPLLQGYKISDVYKSAAYTVTGSDTNVDVNATACGNPCVLKLPAPSTVTNATFVIQKVDYGTAQLMITTASSTDTFINGFNNYNLTSAKDTLGLTSNGTIYQSSPSYHVPLDAMRIKGTSLNRFVTQAISGFTPVTISPSATLLIATPFTLGNTAKIDQISIEVSTLVAGSTCRMGIYSDNGTDYPAFLVVGSDVGTVSGASTGVKTNTFTPPITLHAGLYWLSSQCSTPTTILLRGIPAAAVPNVIGILSTMGATAAGTGWSATNTFGALPHAFPTTSVAAITTNIVEIGLRLIG